MDGSYQHATRPPPPSGPTPPYARALKRVYPYSLRPVLLLTTIISTIYLVVLAASDFKQSGYDFQSSKLKAFLIVEGALFMAAAAIEIFGFFAAFTQRLPLARTYSFASVLALLAVLASEIIGIIVIFTLQSDIINGCTQRNTGRSTTTSNGWLWDDDDSSQNGTPLSQADATNYCSNRWENSRTWSIVWLLVTTILGLLFITFSFGYVRQLLDPSSVRMARNPWAQTNQQQSLNQPPVSMYAGQGGGGGAYDPHYHQHANPYAYPPPPGPPPQGWLPGYAQDRMPPLYDGANRPNSVDLDDSKSGAEYGHGLGYGYGAGTNRPGSSRSVYREQDAEDEQVKRDSGDTLRGEETKPNQQIRRDSDEGPRV